MACRRRVPGTRTASASPIPAGASARARTYGDLARRRRQSPTRFSGLIRRRHQFRQPAPTAVERRGSSRPTSAVDPRRRRLSRRRRDDDEPLPGRTGPCQQDLGEVDEPVGVETRKMPAARQAASIADRVTHQRAGVRLRRVHAGGLVPPASSSTGLPSPVRSLGRACERPPVAEVLGSRRPPVLSVRGAAGTGPAPAVSRSAWFPKRGET